MVDQFAEVLVKQIRVELNNLADQLASGRARTMEDYRYTCGVIQGLATAESFIKDLAKKTEEAE